jgi:predicted methyltransferase
MPRSRVAASAAGWLFALALILPQPPLAESLGAARHLNTAFQSPDFDQWREAFERPGREVFDERFRIIAALGLQPGMAVADIGAGSGLFTLLFARAVGPVGRVYAVDIAQTFIDKILERTEDYHVANVIGVLGTQEDTGLAEASIDLAFVCDTYHHFENPKAMLASISRALRPQGELVVIDYRRTPDLNSTWVQGHVRAGQQQVSEEIAAAGFVPMGEEQFLRHNWFLRFRKVTEDKPEFSADPSSKHPKRLR